MDASSDAESDAESTRTPPRASDRHCGMVRLSHRCLNSIRQLVLHVFVCLRFCATPREASTIVGMDGSTARGAGMMANANRGFISLNACGVLSMERERIGEWSESAPLCRTSRKYSYTQPYVLRRSFCTDTRFSTASRRLQTHPRAQSSSRSRPTPSTPPRTPPPRSPLGSSTRFSTRRRRPPPTPRAPRSTHPSRFARFRSRTPSSRTRTRSPRTAPPRSPPHRSFSPAPARFSPGRSPAHPSLPAPRARTRRPLRTPTTSSSPSSRGQSTTRARPRSTTTSPRVRPSVRSSVLKTRSVGFPISNARPRRCDVKPTHPSVLIDRCDDFDAVFFANDPCRPSVDFTHRGWVRWIDGWMGSGRGVFY